MGPKPHPDLTIERIDNNGPYSKENCAWKTRMDQANNRRDNYCIEYNGETKTLAEWARELKISYNTLDLRVKSWGIERAFTEPVRSPKGENINAKG